MDFLLTNDAEMRDVEEDRRVLRRAQRGIDVEPEKPKQYFLGELPEDLA